VFIVDGVWTTGDNGKPLWLSTPLGVAAISQSCDAAQASRNRIHVAPVIHLKGADATAAAAGKRISYAALSELGAGHFVDLETVVTLPKAVLGAAPRTRGVIKDEHVRRFAGSVARKYGRFAFPDEVVRALDPLRDVLRSKARREQSALGRILADIYGIRVEAAAPGWETPPYDLQLIVIFEPGVVPEFSDGELPDEPTGLRDRVLGKSQAVETRVNQIATEFGKDAMTAEAKYWLIMWLAQAWAARCEKAAKDGGVDATVRSVSPDVATVDDFPLSRYNNREDLDLDYLSEPLPRAPRTQ
jgi:hypothetical protein